jgi:hypothetical protein
MNARTILCVGAALAFPALAVAANSTAGTAAQVRPDGSAVTEDFTSAGGSTAWFSAVLIAGHSYVAEVEAPFNGAGTLGGNSPLPSLAIFRNNGTTGIASTDISDCAPSTGTTGDRESFTPSSADMAAGAIKIRVTNGTPGTPNYFFRFRLYESGLSCPRWSINGYFSFVDLQNTSDCALNATLVLYKSDGTVASSTPLPLNANGATQIQINSGMAGGVLVGSAAVFHDGTKGAVTGGIYQVQPGTLSGANFLWPFSEIRSSGSTSGQ